MVHVSINYRKNFTSAIKMRFDRVMKDCMRGVINPFYGRTYIPLPHCVEFRYVRRPAYNTTQVIIDPKMLTVAEIKECEKAITEKKINNRIEKKAEHPL